MKKFSLALLALFVLFLSACSSNQVAPSTSSSTSTDVQPTNEIFTAKTLNVSARATTSPSYFAVLEAEDGTRYNVYISSTDAQYWGVGDLAEVTVTYKIKNGTKEISNVTAKNTTYRNN